MKKGDFTDLLNEALSQNCNILLDHLGYEQVTAVGDVQVEGRLLHLEFDQWFDYGTGDTGDVFDLAKGIVASDVLAETLFNSAGLKWNNKWGSEIVKDDLRRWNHLVALSKLNESFPIGKASSDIQTFLTSKKVSKLSDFLFSYIPAKQDVINCLSPEELQSFDIDEIVDRFLIWEFRNKVTSGYCVLTLGVNKCVGVESIFFGSSLDELRDKPTVYFTEGIFNYTSLLELGKVGCGVSSFNLTDKQKTLLRIKLKMRNALHPDWKFIVLEEDRKKNYELYRWLLSEGIVCQYLKIDAGCTVNSQHIANASKIQTCLNNYPQSIDHLSIGKTAGESIARVTKTILTSPQILDSTKSFFDHSLDRKFTSVIRKGINQSIPWRKIYDNRVEFMYRTKGKVNVLFRDNDKTKTFLPAEMPQAMRKYQLYDFKYDVRNMCIEFLDEVYIVGGDKRPSRTEYNLYAKTPYLSETLKPGQQYPLPVNISRLLDNLCSKDVQEYLLNMLAHYFQTFEKPQVIPYFTGGQGTGKGTFAEILGVIVGGFTLLNTKNIMDTFDSWKNTSAVVLLDEIRGGTIASRKTIERELKPLINIQQTIRGIYKEARTVTVNNLILIANNTDYTDNVFRITHDDRRYLVVSGGKNINLAKTKWWNRDNVLAEIPAFARYLRTRPVDKAKVGMTLLTSDKKRLMNESIPQLAHDIKRFLDEYTNDGRVVPKELALTQLHEEINRKCRVVPPKRAQDIKKIMEEYLSLDELSYWSKPNNKSHFKYEKYYNEHVLNRSADLE